MRVVDHQPDSTNIDDDTFIRFMHSGSPLWVNQGFKQWKESDMKGKKEEKKGSKKPMKKGKC